MKHSNAPVRKVVRQKISQQREAGVAQVEMRCVRNAVSGELTFTLPEAPSANRWWRKFRNRMVLSDEAREYKSLVRMAYRSVELRGEIEVRVKWFRGRRAGDLDKRVPIVLDALQGVAYANDSQIVKLSAERIEAPRNPCMIVTVRAA